MTRAALAEARAFESWQDYQEAFKRVIAPLLQWDDADDPPHTAAEILHGLELTWHVISLPARLSSWPIGGSLRS